MEKMKTSKKRLAYVAGPLEDWRSLSAFSNLKDFEVEVHAIHSDQLLNGYQSHLKLFVYENIDDMPGYMRGLEDRVHNVDILVSNEASSLSTFQATRIAKKYNIPNFIISSEYRPDFYKEHQNITAIQSDNLKSAYGFLALSKKAEKFLAFSNVPRDNVVAINSCFPDFVPENIDQRKIKFRNYVGFKGGDILVGVVGDLNDAFAGEKILNAVKIFKAQDPYRSDKVKFIFIGDGPHAKSLKYKAFEMGIGGRVSFLHEDYSNYYWDLFAGIDVVLHVEPQEQKMVFHDKFPRYLLDALAMQSIVISSSGSVASELVGDHGLRMKDDSEFGLADMLVHVLDRFESLKTKLTARSSLAEDIYSPKSAGTVLNASFLEAISDNATRNPNEEINRYVEDAEIALKRHDGSQALMLLEELLLRDLPHQTLLGQVWKLKGDALTQIGRQEEAIESYATSIELDPKNSGAYSALGFATLYGHSYKDAITFFKKALALNPDDLDSMLGLGISFNRNNMHGEALYWIRKAAIAGGHDSKAMTVMIQTSMETPQIELGIAALEKVIDSIGESGRLLMSLGRLYMKDGRSVEGNDLVQKALNMENPKAKDAV